jgi:hypothetical protein
MAQPLDSPSAGRQPDRQLLLGGTAARGVSRRSWLGQGDGHGTRSQRPADLACRHCQWRTRHPTRESKAPADRGHRMTIVPAVMALLGGNAWWLPR